MSPLLIHIYSSVCLSLRFHMDITRFGHHYPPFPSFDFLLTRVLNTWWASHSLSVSYQGKHGYYVTIRGIFPYMEMSRVAIFTLENRNQLYFNFFKKDKLNEGYGWAPSLVTLHAKPLVPSWNVPTRGCNLFFPLWYPGDHRWACVYQSTDERLLPSLTEVDQMS